MNRRTLFSGAIGLAGLSLHSRLPLAGFNHLFASGGAGGAGGGGVLVLLQLSGGNDGLSTVIPWADDEYARSRRSTRFTESEVLGVDEYSGLHPELSYLRDELGGRRLAIVQGVGYPNPNRSHFKSMDIWHSASPSGRAMKSGWIGRLSETVFDKDFNPERVVHVGDSTPYSLHSKARPALSFAHPEGYRWIGNEPEMTELAGRVDENSGSGALGHLRGVMRDAARSSQRVRAAVGDYETSVEYPKGDLARSLHTAAALIKSDLGCRVLSLEQTGYDTHQGQRSTHDRLMAELDGGLQAFRKDLSGTEAGQRTVIMAFSEFGRRIAENASSGTDHGTAGPMFVIGDRVAGGLHGEHPSLVDRDDGDMKFTTDFRSVYASLIGELFATDPERILGARYKPLSLFS